MKALVTGATGFIGSNLVRELVAKGYEVACLARKTSDLRCLEGFDVKILHVQTVPIKRPSCGFPGNSVMCFILRV